jgi:hypothetical protein
LSGSTSPLNVFGVSGLTGGVSFGVVGFDIGATPFKSVIWAAHGHSQPHNAAATINARQQTASAIHIVVTFNVCGIPDSSRTSRHVREVPMPEAAAGI